MNEQDERLSRLKQEMLAKANEKGLSDDAKAVASAWFGAGRVGSTLHFGMIESRPSDRARKGLDELVDAGVLSVAADASGAGMTYTCLEPCQPYWAWFMIESGMADNLAVNPDDPRFGFKLTEPVDPGRKGARRATMTVSGPPDLVDEAREEVERINELRRGP